MASKKRDGICGDDEATGKKQRRRLGVDDEAFDSDAEIPTESIKNRLSWRTEDSFSDWKIIIKVSSRHSRNDGSDDKNKNGDDSESQGSFKEVTYNVHKNILAFGPRRSEYFVCLFDNDANFSETENKTSRIELDELSAKAFPLLLDYIYTPGHKMSFSTNNSTALYSLGKYFGVRRLQQEAKQFCLQDMQNNGTCGTYYEHATVLQAESILQAAAKFCRKNILSIDPNTSPLLDFPDPQFWFDLLDEHSENGTMAGVSYYLSGHIAIFCSRHGAVLSHDDLKRFADENHLLNSQNRIQPVLPLVLLDLDRHHHNQQGEEQVELTSLQTRCVDAIIREKAKVDPDDEWARTALKALPPLVMHEIMVRGLFRQS